MYSVSVAAALQVLLPEVSDNGIKNEPCDCPHKSYYYYYYSTMALANKDDPISNGVVYCYEVSVDLGALNRSRWRRE